MRSFLIKTGMFAALVFGPLLAILLLPLPYDHDLSTIIDKLRTLKEEKGGRIVFVGGSGLLFGIDSARVAERFQRPVVNLGLYAGFGITTLLREIRPYLHAGDMVVLSPEYTVIYDHYNDETRKWIYAIAPLKNLAPLYEDGKGAKLFISDINGLVRSKFRALPAAVRDVFDARSLMPVLREGRVSYPKYFSPQGDSLRQVRTVPSPEMLLQYGKNYFEKPDFQNQSFSAVNAFCRDVSAAGIPVFFVFPAYPEKEFQRQAEGMRRYERRLRKELECPILGTPEDFLYPYHFFTDTVHHLDHEGRRERTERMIALLEQGPMGTLRSREGVTGKARLRM